MQLKDIADIYPHYFHSEFIAAERNEDAAVAAGINGSSLHNTGIRRLLLRDAFLKFPKLILNTEISFSPSRELCRHEVLGSFFCKVYVALVLHTESKRTVKVREEMNWNIAQYVCNKW